MALLTQKQWQDERRQQVRELVVAELRAAGGEMPSLHLARALGVPARGLHHYLADADDLVIKNIRRHPDGLRRSVVWYALVEE